MQISELGYIVIGAGRVAEWKRFGASVLGMEVVERPDATWLRMDDWANRLVVLQDERDALLSLGWCVSREDQLADVRAAVEAAGASTTESTAEDCRARGVQAFFTFEDPGGNRHEVFWGRMKAGAGFVSPAGVKGFLSGDLGLGHVVLAANGRFDEVASFWRKTGLMKLTDFRYVPATASSPAVRTHFYRCNARHHSVAYADVGRSQFGCHHFMVEVATLDEVGLAHDRAVSHQATVACTIGRHTNDEMISVYIQTPGGFLVEFGCGAKLIGNDHEPANYDNPDLWGHEWQESWRQRWLASQTP